MRLFTRLVFVLCMAGFATNVTAQADSNLIRPLRIAVFAPVYIDSAFSFDNYKLGKANLPKYILPGLDFYNGVMMAVDSLNADKAPVEVLFYDSKSAQHPLQQTIADAEFTNISLIIASFNTRTDVKPLADYALTQNIPLISATYPNDGGVTENPFFVMINPRLNAHIEAIYRYLHRTYAADNIIMFRKKGNIEDAIQAMLMDMNKKTQGLPLKLKTIDLPENFEAKQVTGYLDSTRQNILLCGALDETFARNLTRVLSNNKKYPVSVMGMPTWEGVKDIGKDLDIVYSTPYNPIRSDKLSQQLITKYRAKYSGRPSDMFFKGYESMYHFTKLLLKHGNNFINNLSDTDFTLFDEYDIQPVRANKESMEPDYFVNKKIYFVRKIDGKIRSVN